MTRTAVLLAVAIGGLARATSAEEPLRVFAAASLTESFREIAAAFEAKPAGAKVELRFAATQVLRAEIEGGAPADVFASADLAQADALRQAGQLPAFTVFAHNSLVLAVPAKGSTILRFEDVASPGHKVVVASPAGPAGLYTLQMLARVGASGLFGDFFRSRVQANIAGEEVDVREVLGRLARGEADAGFVFKTDAATSAAVTAIAVPDGLNATAEYVIGVPAKARNPEAARRFVELVLSPEGQAVLRKHGFE